MGIADSGAVPCASAAWWRDGSQSHATRVNPFDNDFKGLAKAKLGTCTARKQLLRELPATV